MIQSLRIFVDLVETRSFTEAGRRNYLTQSAVSQHIKALERKFGHRLLERSTRQVGLTPAGRLVQQTARRILQQYAQLEAALRKPPREVSGTLRVAATLTVGLYELAPYVSAFLKQYPRIDVQLTYLRAPEVYEAVLTDRASLGLAAHPAAHPQLKMELFKNDHLVVIAPPTQPWITVKRVSLKRLNGQPFIAMQAGLLPRKVIDRALRAAKVQVNTIHEFDNIELVKRAVEVGVGLSIVPSDMVVNETRAGTLKRLEILEGPLYHPVKVLTKKFAECSLPAQQFIRFLLAAQQDEIKKASSAP